MTTLARLGLAGRHTYILTVRGRKTGKRYLDPGHLPIEDGSRWLVAPSGDELRVRNTRAAGEVEYTRAGRSERMSIEEVGAQQAARSCSDTSSDCRSCAPFFNVSPDSPLAEFETHAPHHPSSG